MSEDLLFFCICHGNIERPGASTNESQVKHKDQIPGFKAVNLVE